MQQQARTRGALPAGLLFHPRQPVDWRNGRMCLNDCLNRIREVQKAMKNKSRSLSLFYLQFILS